jgi:hypothetical protein
VWIFAVALMQGSAVFLTVEGLLYYTTRGVGEHTILSLLTYALFKNKELCVHRTEEEGSYVILQALHEPLHKCNTSFVLRFVSLSFSLPSFIYSYPVSSQPDLKQSKLTSPCCTCLCATVTESVAAVMPLEATPNSYF